MIWVEIDDFYDFFSEFHYFLIIVYNLIYDFNVTANVKSSGGIRYSLRCALKIDEVADGFNLNFEVHFTNSYLGSVLVRNIIIV